MPDPTRKRFGYGQLRPLRPACGQNWAGSCRPDPTSRILFSSVFPKKALVTVQNRPGSDLGGLARVWLLSSGLKASRCVGFQAGCNRPATSFPLLNSVPFFQRLPDNIVRNQPGSDLVLADCARFWPNGSGPEQSQCARIIRPASGQCFPADLTRHLTRHVYWVIISCRCVPP